VFERIKKLFKNIGPGWVTGASDDDPSGIGTYSVAGAKFGFLPLWTMPFLIPFMYAVQEMCARVAQVTGRGLAGVIRHHYPRWALYVVVMLLVFANTMNIAADIGAMAAAMKLVVNGPFLAWALFFTIATLILEIFVSYKVYSRYLKLLTLSLFAYILTAFAVHINWLDVVSHLLSPKITLNKDFLFMLVAIFGTTISPYLFFWQASSEVEDEISKGRLTLTSRRGAKNSEIHTMRADVLSGMLFSNIVAFFIMLTAAVTLFPNGIVIETAQDAALALKPLAGDFASLLFAFGIIGTGLLAIPVLAGSASYALAESFNWNAGLYRKVRDAHGFYGIITIATLIGLFINFLGIDPIKLLIWTAVVNGAIAPILLYFIIHIANNKKIMGRWHNDRFSNLLGWMTVAIMAGSIVFLILL